MKIPDIILFKAGDPIRWISSKEDGTVYKKPLPDKGLQKDTIQKTATRAPPNNRLQYVLDYLYERVALHATTKLIDELPCCIAWYVSGEHQTITLQSLKQLSYNKAWLYELIALQESIPYINVLQGEYHSTSEDHLVENRTPKLQNSIERLTEKLCHVIEDAHIDPKTNNHTVRIVNAKMEYYEDNSHYIWFSKPINVEILNIYSLPKDEVKEAGFELLKNLQIALRNTLNEDSELTVDDLMSYFDPNNQGNIPISELKPGIENVGMRVSNEVFEEISFYFPRNKDGLFGVEQLEQFIFDENIQNLGNNINNNGRSSSSTTITTLSRPNTTSGATTTTTTANTTARTNSITSKPNNNNYNNKRTLSKTPKLNKKKSASITGTSMANSSSSSNNRNDIRPQTTTITKVRTLAREEAKHYNEIEESAKISSLNDTEPYEVATWSRPLTKKTYEEIKNKQQQQKQSQNEMKRMMTQSQSLPAISTTNANGNGKRNNNNNNCYKTINCYNVENGKYYEEDYDENDEEEYENKKNEMLKYVDKAKLNIIEFGNDDNDDESKNNNRNNEKEKESNNNNERVMLNYSLLDNKVTEDKEFKNMVEILLIPDFFQPTDVLQKLIYPFVVDYSHCKILIPSLPGYSYSVYPKKQELSTKYISETLHKFIKEIVHRKIWGYDQKCLRLVCGCGNGSNILLNWMTNHLKKDNNLSYFYKSIKLMFFSNPFCCVDEDLNESFSHMIKMVKNPSINERYHNIINLLFSQDYLQLKGLDKVMQQYSRLCFNWMKSTHSECVDESATPLLKCAMKSENLCSKISNLNIPVFILGSANDQLIYPNNSDYILHSIPNVKTIDNLEECINSNFESNDKKGKCIYSLWTNAGHDILLERTSFFINELKEIIDIYDDLYEELSGKEVDTNNYNGALLGENKENPLKHYHAKKHKIYPDIHRGEGDFKKYGKYAYGKTVEKYKDQIEEAKIEEEKEKEEKMRIENMNKPKREGEEKEEYQTRKQKQEIINNLTHLDINYEGLEGDELLKSITKQIKQLYDLGGNLALRFELRKRGIYGGGSGDELKERLKNVILDEIEDEKKQKEINQIREENRKKQEEIRRLRMIFEKDQVKKQDEELMKEEIERYRIKHEKMKEKQNMYMERRLMVIEDRSMERYIKWEKEEKRWKVQSEYAKLFIKGVQDLYTEDHNKEEEEMELRLKAAEREREMIEEEEESRKRLEELTNIDSDLNEKNIREQIKQTYSDLDKPELYELLVRFAMLKYEVNELKERKIAALRSRETVVNAKEVASEEILRMNRQYRCICKALKAARKVNKEGTGEAVVTANNQIKEFTEEKEELNRAIERAEPQYQAATKILQEADIGVQRLQILLKEKQKQILEVKTQCNEMTEELNKIKAKHRNNEENATKKQVLLDKEIAECKYRMNLIQKELDRAKKLKTSYIDTSIIEAGIRQRIDKKIFIENSKHEYEQLENKLKTWEEEREREIKLQEENNAGYKEVLKDLEILRVLNEENTLLYEQAVSRPMIDQRSEEDKSEEMAKRKRLESYQYGSNDNLAAIIRKKPFNVRNKIERNWTAIDRVLNPEIYEKIANDPQHILNIESEYQTKLTREQLVHIRTMPNRLNEALPVLLNREEIHAHTLIKTIDFNKGIDYWYSEDKNIKLTQEEEDLLVSMKKRVVNLRAKLPEDRNESENEWCILDCVLYPELYSEEERKVAEEKYPNLISDKFYQILYKTKKQLSPENRICHEIYNRYNPDCVRNSRDNETMLKTKILHDLSEVPNTLRQGMDGLILTNQFLEIFKLNQSSLLIQETRVHTFEVPNDIPFIQLRVIINYKGMLLHKSGENSNESCYIVGRIGASLYRKLPNEEKSVSIGYSAEDDVILNTETQTGRIVIHHEPIAIPVISGIYQIVINSASRTKYSITVEAQVGQTIKYALADCALKAEQLQSEITKYDKEIEHIEECVELAEWKRKVCDKVLKNTLTEAKNKEINIKKLQDQLAHSRDLTSNDILRISREISKLESEFANVVSLLGYRRDEFNDIVVSLTQMKAALNIRKKKVDEGKVIYNKWKECIPDGFTLIYPDKSRTELLQYLSKEAMPGYLWVADMLKKELPNMMSDADRMRHKPLEELDKDDRAWRLYDYIINPSNYPSNYVDPDVEKSPYKQIELKRLKHSQPCDLLPEELIVHKLLTKYSESEPKASESLGDIAVIARSKPAVDRSTEEQEWVRIERVLCPELYGPCKAEKGDGLDDKDLLGITEPEGPFKLEELKRIMKAKSEDLTDEKEIRARHLIDKYMNNNKDKNNENNNNNNTRNIYNANERKDVNNCDIDERCIILLGELKRVNVCKKNFIDSNILEGVVQRYQTPILQQLLNEEIEKLLIKQIEERENDKYPNIMNNEVKKKEFKFVDANPTAIDIEEKEEMARQLKLNNIIEQSNNRSSANMKSMMSRSGANISVNNRSMLLKSARSNNPNYSSAASYKDFARAKLRQSVFRMEAAEEEESKDEGNVCKACGGKCTWKPMVDIEQLTNRSVELENELLSIKQLPANTKSVESCVPRSAKQNGNNPIKYDKADCILEMQIELKEIERKIKLTEVDKELHNAYNATSSMITIKSIQGNEQTMFKEYAIETLEEYRQQLIAEDAAYDVMNGILDWMYEGWYFGEIESKYNVMGYVPSIDAKIITVHNQIKNNLKKEKKNEDEESFESLAKAKESKMMIDHELIFKQKKKMSDELFNQTERTLKFGIFSLVLEYFRIMTLLRKGEVANRGILSEMNEKEESEERKAMIKEKQQLEKRLREIKEATEKAMIGQKRREEKYSGSGTISREKLIKKANLRKKQEASIIKIQSYIRGHLGRKVAHRIETLTAEEKAERDLKIAAAICIQRVYRGHVERMELKYSKMRQISVEMKKKESEENNNNNASRYSNIDVKAPSWYESALNIDYDNKYKNVIDDELEGKAKDNEEVKEEEEKKEEGEKEKKNEDEKEKKSVRDDNNKAEKKEENEKKDEENEIKKEEEKKEVKEEDKEKKVNEKQEKQEVKADESKTEEKKEELEKKVTKEEEKPKDETK